MNYNEALEYIHSINWEFCKPGLERISELCQGLGNPQNKLKFIHVAGSNGKGSFCSMLQSVLTEAGYKTGLYTSPYIRCFNERMAIDGEMIDNDQLCKITERVKQIADKMTDKPTEFELVTAIALEYFKDNCCDIVVLECGLGGRLDSTNIVSTTIFSVITSISLEHTAILGDTIEKIAYEKAGIIKENGTCIWCAGDKGVDAMLKVAKEKNASVVFVNHDEARVKKADLDGTIISYKEFKNIKIKLLGSYQILNASNVLSAISELRLMGYEISDEAVRAGMEKASWSARFERILDTPPVVFDGAHNPEGIVEALKSIKKYFKGQVLILTGVMADKNYTFIASKLKAVAKRVYTVTPNNPRALDSKKYAQVFCDLGVDAKGYETIDLAVSEAIKDARGENLPLVALGSLYMYNDVYEAVLKTKS
ncbi:MAG: bifunctional folylpolyglutamate synthase/dihydrofolate synthase [Clostridia bacterium]|nr:bifunctional folylpolyglutamate synthase/dihydrofolate synthase [Clostridia bacterium]